MPTIVKLPPEEVRAIQDKGKSQRQLIAEQYDALLASFGVGDWGNVVLDPDEARPTVRNRLNNAAERRGFALRFTRSRDEHMRFQVVSVEEEVAPKLVAPGLEAVSPVAAKDVPEPEVVAPVAEAPKRRGGRPRKVKDEPSSIEPAALEVPKRRSGRRKATGAPAEA